MGFSKYRYFGNDSTMVADVGFKKQLWALDPELDVVWDWAANRWEIWRFPGQAKVKKKIPNDKAHHVMKIETKDRNFRELGADVLLKLQAGDTHKFSLKQLVDYFNQLDDNVLREKERVLKDKISAMTRDFVNFNYFFKVQVPQSFKVERAITGV